MTAKFETNKILVSGTGKMGKPLLLGIGNDHRYKLLPWAISDEEGDSIQVGEDTFGIIPLKERLIAIPWLMDEYGPNIVVDAVPAAFSQGNAEFYSQFGDLPVIMMSTGIKDPSKIRNTLMLPNACLQIMAWGKFVAEQKENMFAGGGYSLGVLEIHQEIKPDVSGTALAMTPKFRRLGLEFDDANIVWLRGEKHYLKAGIPRLFWGAFGYHEYTISIERKDDAVLMSFFEQMADYFRKNKLFKDLFYYDLSYPTKNENFSEKIFYWGNDAHENGDDDPYRTLSFTVSLISTETKTEVQICHCILGHEPYVQGVINQALPFMQEKCMDGLTGENFTSLQLYDWVMKPPTADEFIRRKGVYNPDQWTPCPSDCAYCNDSFFGHTHPHSTQNWIEI